MPIVEKKIGLLKILIYLVLCIPAELCDQKPKVFGMLFEMALNQDNSEICENILWLISSLLELRDSEEQ